MTPILLGQFDLTVGAVLNSTFKEGNVDTIVRAGILTWLWQQGVLPDTELPACLQEMERSE